MNETEPASAAEPRRELGSQELNQPLGKLFIQGLRAGVFIFVLVLAVIHHLFQGSFFSWEIYRNFYLVAGMGLILPLLSLPFLEQFFRQRFLLAASFVLDLILISILLFTSQLNQSIFLFLYLLLIILGGLVFHTRGAIMLALVCSLLSTSVLIVGEDLKSVGFFFLLLLNNIAFFSVAWISGFLSEQLQIQGLNLSDLRKLNDSIVETVPMGLATVLEDGQIVKVNSGFETILGADHPPEKKIAEYFPAGTFSSWPLEAPKEVRMEQGQDVKILTLKMLPQVSLDQKTYLLVVEDETQVRKLEFAVQQSEKLAAVGQLAAGIAHEIRNPLAGISGSIELLSQQSQGEDDKKLTKIILKEIDRLNLLISEFLDFAKPEKPPVDPVDVGQLFRELLDQVVLNRQLRQEVKQERHIEEGLKIRGHRDKLKQAFLNMMINSYQAMAITENPQLEVRCARVGDKVQVSLRDTGVGMDEKVRSRMFEPFLTTKPKGTGLGLAITHKILETHQGKIFVESAVGQGTRVIVEFPVLET